VGHNADFQDLLRCQPLQSGAGVDLVSQALGFLSLVAGAQEEVAQGGDLELELVGELLTFLVAACQGPRQLNQRLVAASDAIMCVCT